MDETKSEFKGCKNRGNQIEFDYIIPTIAQTTASFLILENTKMYVCEFYVSFQSLMGAIAQFVAANVS